MPINKRPNSQKESGPTSLDLLNFLVGATGFEPATPCAQGRCATRLRYAPTFFSDELLNSLACFTLRYCPSLPARPLKPTCVGANVAAVMGTLSPYTGVSPWG